MAVDTLPLNSNEIEEMFTLGQAVFLEGIEKLKDCKEQNRAFIHRRSELIIKKRLAVVELTHGLELIFKAVLKRKGYSINKIRNGIYKEDQKIGEILTEKTIELEELISFFKRENPTMPFSAVDNLRKLRNQIIHKGTQVPEKKKEYFVGAIDCLVGIYRKEGINHKKFITIIEEAKNGI